MPGSGQLLIMLAGNAPRRAARIFAATLIAALTTISPTSGFAAEYTLGPGDVLHVKVAEWQTIEGAFRDWSSVNGDYSVGPDGALSIPLAGEIPTAGDSDPHRLSDVAVAVGESADIHRSGGGDDGLGFREAVAV